MADISAVGLYAAPPCEPLVLCIATCTVPVERRQKLCEIVRKHGGALLEADLAGLREALSGERPEASYIASVPGAGTLWSFPLYA